MVGITVVSETTVKRYIACIILIILAQGS